MQDTFCTRETMSSRIRFGLEYDDISEKPKTQHRIK